MISMCFDKGMLACGYVLNKCLNTHTQSWLEWPLFLVSHIADCGHDKKHTKLIARGLSVALCFTLKGTA